MGFYGLAAALALVACIASGAIGYGKGSASRNAEIASYQAAIKVSEKLADEADERAAKASAKVVIQYRDKVRIVREVTPGEIQLIEVIKRERLPDLSPSFRVLHDSAAAGSKAPENPAGTDAAPVPVEDAAETIRQNYATCRADQERLAGLQEIIRAQ